MQSSLIEFELLSGRYHEKPWSVPCYCVIVLYCVLCAMALLYSASEIELLQTAELNRHPYLKNLGPELLDEAIRPEDIIARFNEKPWSVPCYCPCYFCPLLFLLFMSPVIYVPCYLLG